MEQGKLGQDTLKSHSDKHSFRKRDFYPGKEISASQNPLVLKQN